MKPLKPILLEIKDIRNLFDVRRSLNDERILALAELIEGGVELPPIEVIASDGGYAFVDGRHRAAAHSLLDKPKILALVVEKKDPASMFSRALLANWGGALPPTVSDIQHTVRRMLETGASAQVVRKNLSFLPQMQITRYIKDANAAMKKVRLRQALDAVANGLRMGEAADKFDVDVELLKAAISGHKKKFGAGDVGIEADQKTHIKRVLKSANMSIQKRLENLLAYVDAGEVRVQTASKVIDEWESQLVKGIRRIQDWRQRLEAISTPTADVTEKVG